MSDQPTPRTQPAPEPFPAAPGTIDHGDSARFEGEVDLASERPATTTHGLRPDKSVRWLVGGLVGASLLLAAVISIARGPDEEPEVAARNPEVQLLAAQLEAPVSHTVRAVELMRMEWVTAQSVRAMADAPKTRSLARRDAAPAASAAVTPPASSHAQPLHDGATPARTTPRASTNVRDLPAPVLDAGDANAKPPAGADAPVVDDASAPAGDRADTPAAQPKPPAQPAELPSVADDDDEPAAPEDRSAAPT